MPFALPVAVLVGWSFIGSGLLSWQPGQPNRLGLVLVFTGFAWFASMLSDAHNPVLFTAGEVVYPFFYAGFLYLILSFPSGRLRGRLDRALVVVTIVLVAVINPAGLLFTAPQMLCRNCPANLLEVARQDTAMMGATYLVRIGAIAVALTGIGLLVGRWRRASRPQRRAVMPVVVAGAVAFAVLITAYGAAALGAATADAFGRVAWFALAAVPVAVLVVFIQRRLAQGAVAGLVIELGGRGAAADLREALSRALGDPSLALAYWYPDQSRYVDSDGRPVELPEPGAARSSTLIERDGQPVAAVIHDPALHYNSALVDSVCAAAGMSLDNERLAAELRAKLAELQASRARLAQTADTERRRIERNLHDGAQQQLVSLKISLGLARQLVTACPRQPSCSPRPSTRPPRRWKSCANSPAGSTRRCWPTWGCAPRWKPRRARRRSRSPSRPRTWAGTRSRSRPRCTSASWKRCRTPRNTRRHQRPTSLSAMTASAWCSPSPTTARASTRPPPRRELGYRA